MSPNAAEFSKYGTHPVSMFTGTPSINIPIYEINTGKIKVPISLSYHASGIKVTQSATWVGLGWSLNAGGTISRSIRGMADEETLGYFSDTRTNEAIEQLTDPIIVRQYANSQRDLYPDFFSYNFSGKSGKFLFRKATKTFDTFPFEPIVIKRKSGPNLGDLNNTYSIVDDDGSTYYFEKKEISFNDNNTTGLQQHDQSWYLTKIVSFDLTDEVTFIYRNDFNNSAGAQTEEYSFSTSRTYIKPASTGPIYRGYYPGVPLGDGQMSDHTKQVSTISHSHIALSEIVYKQGKVVFEGTTARKDYNGNSLDKITVYAKDAQNTYQPQYFFRFNYGYFEAVPSPTSQFESRLKLLSFQKQDASASKSETHSFDYNAMNPPSMLSCSQDYWGFYNGANNGNAFNGSLLPAVLPSHPDLYHQYFNNEKIGSADRNPSDAHIEAGMLEKITYPTGGYTVFDYEPNKYKTDITTSQLVNTYWAAASIALAGKGKGQVVRDTKTFTLPSDAYGQDITIAIELSPHTNPGAADVPQQIIFRNLTTGVTLFVLEHTGDFTKVLKDTRIFSLIPGETYQLSGVVDDDAPTKIYADVTYKRVNTSTTSSIRNGGGIRIASMSTYDGINATPIKKTYQYNDNGLGTLLQSDVDIFLNNYTKSRFGYCTSLNCCAFQQYGDMITYVGTSVIQQVDLQGSPIIYGKVTETELDGNVPNGKKEYYFNTETDIQRVFNPSVPGGRELINNSFLAGKLGEEINYKYNRISNGYQEVYRKGIDYTEYQKGEEESVVIYKNIIYTNPADAAPCPYSTDPAIRYQEIQREFGFWRSKVKLKGVRETTISEVRTDDQGNKFTTATNYAYSNPKHLYPSEISRTDSKGAQQIEKMLYPGDHPTSDENKAMLDALVGLNVINRPYWQASFRNTQQLKYTRTLFDNTWNNTSNTKAIWVKKVDDYVNIPSLVKTGFLEYKRYDASGNPQSLLTSQQVPITYLWGYNSSYPVAEIKNATYEEVLAVLGEASIEILKGATPGTDEQIHQRLQVLRTDNRLSKAQVSTYTYNPLGAITSAKDVSGRTVYYTYDAFKRLKWVKDQEGNIVQNYIYHYKGQTE